MTCDRSRFLGHSMFIGVINDMLKQCLHAQIVEINTFFISVNASCM